MADRYKGPPESLSSYEAVVAATPAAERKGATTPYTSRNGHMFSFLDVSGSMALRLSEDARAEFIERYETTLSQQHGHVMKEYVVVPAELLGQTAELSQWFERSYTWIGTLRPKATTRR